jgi:hypothetical protein
LASEAGCKTPFGFSKQALANRFLDLSNAPDELVPSINYDEMPCPKGKKASKRCKERNGEKDEDQPPSKTEGNNNKPSPTGNNDHPSKTSNQPSSTSTQPASSTIQSSSSASPKATNDCAAIGKNDLETLSDEYESDDVTETKRSLRSSLQSRRLLERSFSKKRGAKVCNVALESKRYPPSGEQFMVSQALSDHMMRAFSAPSFCKLTSLQKRKLAYGYNKIHDCNDYSWGEQKVVDSKDYDTDHVTEWSIVSFSGLKPECDHG